MSLANGFLIAVNKATDSISQDDHPDRRNDQSANCQACRPQLRGGHVLAVVGQGPAERQYQQRPYQPNQERSRSQYQECDNDPAQLPHPRRCDEGAALR